MWTFQRISYGTISNYFPQLYQDINIKEFHLLLPLGLLTIYFGIFPSILIDSIQVSLFSIK